jgi:hypothetical protein
MKYFGAALTVALMILTAEAAINKEQSLFAKLRRQLG